MEKASLCERIHYTKHDLAGLDDNLLAVYLQVANSMHNKDWDKIEDKIDRLIFRTMKATGEQTTKRQLNKFKKQQRT